MEAVTKLSKGDVFAADDLRQVRPTAKDVATAKRDGIDAMAVWRDDIEHTMRAREIPADLHAEFRERCGA